jgi:hypothetical protein
LPHLISKATGCRAHFGRPVHGVNLRVSALRPRPHNALRNPLFGGFGLIAAMLWVATLPAAAREVLQEDIRPAPSSSLSKSDALSLAMLWKQTNPLARDYCEVGPTGSMAPVLDSRSILLLERITAADLKKNDISIYVHSAESTTCHRVIDIRPGSVLFEGDNNHEPDGWIPSDRVRWRVVAIIFTQRDAPPSGPTAKSSLTSTARVPAAK